MTRITALVTVYHGTDEHDLVRALDSLAAQTRPADELVIVADGPCLLYTSPSPRD